MVSLQLSVPNIVGSRFKRRPVRCAVERQELFNRIAPVYDNLNDLLSLGQHRIWKRMAVSWSGLVKGLDFSKEQLSIASSRQYLLSKACYNNIEWVEGDALDLPFSNGYFDAITMGYGLRNVVDKRQAMREMFRVLKPGSRVSILDFNKTTQLLTAMFQEWMIDNVVVPTATVYGLAKEYQYLKTSIKEFLTGEELEKLALEVGFSKARHYEIGGGLMGNLVATR
ncbi:UbiE/COQ5 methyltransferase [Corchorus olitorius]|uniref:2-phytyl-1,4-beta-naphthoquinone methyltransferase, chloroplastic n=1 Tax=Corchorus olitorius TaxID=93759 RepID=A0A1R3IC54_9ROSI|nr:UbiE/COQ5 methyltransferase [Corchorus olitorius]